MRKTGSTLLGAAAVAVFLIWAALPGVAAADQVQLAEPDPGTLVNQVEIIPEALEQLQPVKEYGPELPSQGQSVANEDDQEPDDSELGDQPGDWNLDSDEPGYRFGKDVPEVETVPQTPEVTTTPTPETTGTPSTPETETPPSQTETETTPNNPGDRDTLPYTGGNGSLYMILGGLAVGGGVGLAASRAITQKKK